MNFNMQHKKWRFERWFTLLSSDVQVRCFFSRGDVRKVKTNMFKWHVLCTKTCMWWSILQQKTSTTSYGIIHMNGWTCGFIKCVDLNLHATWFSNNMQLRSYIRTYIDNLDTSYGMFNYILTQAYLDGPEPTTNNDLWSPQSPHILSLHDSWRHPSHSLSAIASIDK